MTITTVAGLTAALKAPAPGSRLVLAPGHYGSVALTNAAGLSISSADPKHPAIISGLRVKQSRDLTFDGLEFAFPSAANQVGTTAWGAKVSDSTGVHFKNMRVHGTLDGNSDLDIGGIYFMDGADGSVENSEFTQLRVGVLAHGMAGLRVIGSNFHDLRVFGVQLGVSTKVLIDRNDFTNFHHLPGDHSDAVHMSTVNSSVGFDDVTLTNNLVDQGTGKVMQGLFGDDVGGVPYSNVTVRGNMVVGGNVRAISFPPSTVNLVIDDNDVIPLLGGNNTVISSAPGTPGTNRVHPAMSQAAAAALVAAWLAAR